MTARLAKDCVDVGVCTSDIDASLTFYRDLLGMTYQRTVVIDDTPRTESERPNIGFGNRMHFLTCGNSIVKLWEVSEPPAPAFTGGFHQMAGFRYITLFVTNIHEVAERATIAGVRLVVPLTELRPNFWITVLADPDGNPVELAQG